MNSISATQLFSQRSPLKCDTTTGSMATQRGLVLILGLVVVLLVFCCPVKTSSPCAYAVEEGKSLILYCPKASEQTDRDLVWTIQNAMGHQTQVSRCPAGQSQCKDQQPDHFIANRNIPSRYPDNNDTSDSKNDKQTALAVSSLLLSNLTESHHGMTVACATLNGNSSGDDHSELKSCKIETYRKPKDPICDARKTGDNIITVTCSASNVFPNLVCEINETEFTTLSSRTICVGLMALNNSKMNASSSQGKENDVQTCSAEVHVPIKGNYSYSATMRPQVNPLDEKSVSVVSRDSKPVCIENNSAAVHVRKSDFEHDICSYDEALVARLLCFASGFSEAPTFTWTKNGQSVPKSQIVNHPIYDHNGHSVVSIMTVNINTGTHAQEIECAAHQAKVEGSRLVRQSSSLIIRTPPKAEPLYRSSSQPIIDNVVTVVDTNSTTLSCYIPNGSPLVSMTVVNCYRINRNETPSNLGSQQNQTYSNHSNLVRFTLTGVPGERWACCCSGQHVTGCYKHTSVVEIDFVEKPTPYLHWIPLVCVILFVTLVTFVSIFLYRKRKRIFRRLLKKSDSLNRVPTQASENLLIVHSAGGEAETENAPNCEETTSV